jgi:hypothetical protein
MGMAALILGIASILLSWIPGLGILLGLIAIPLGFIGRRRLLEEGRSSGVAIGGAVMGIIGVLASTSLTVACVACYGLFSRAETQSDAQQVQTGMDWAEQAAQDLANQQPNQPTPAGTPPAPAVPGVPAIPAIPAVPAVTPPAGGQVLTVGTPLNAAFAPGLPVDAEGRPYLDYTLNVAAPAQYTITLSSPNGLAYDPYLHLMQNGVVMQSDDDGGGYPNAQIATQLAPGTYTVRVSSFSRNQIAQPAPFTLVVSGG